MIYPTESLEVWCEKHGLTPVADNCKCGRELRTTVPIRMRDGVGLESPLCECGDGMKLAIIHPSGESLKVFEEALKGRL